MKEHSQWRVIATSMQGKAHKRLGTPCEDFYFWKLIHSDTLVAAVADGAGSSRLGGIGAKLAALTAVEKISSYLATSPLPSHDQHWEKVFGEILLETRLRLEAEAITRETALQDLATTLIITVTTPQACMVAQLGDGAVVVKNGEDSFISFTSTLVSEFFNETIFISSPNILDSINTTIYKGKISQISILSDGLYTLAFDLKKNEPYTPFFKPLFQFAEEASDVRIAERELRNFLSSPKVTQRTDDDLTVIIATWMG